LVGSLSHANVPATGVLVVGAVRLDTITSLNETLLIEEVEGLNEVWRFGGRWELSSCENKRGD